MVLDVSGHGHGHRGSFKCHDDMIDFLDEEALRPIIGSPGVMPVPDIHELEALAAVRRTRQNPSPERVGMCIVDN